MVLNLTQKEFYYLHYKGKSEEYLSVILREWSNNPRVHSLSFCLGLELSKVSNILQDDHYLSTGTEKRTLYAFFLMCKRCGCPNQMEMHSYVLVKWTTLMPAINLQQLMRSIKMFTQLQKGWLRQMVTSGWPYGKGTLKLRGHKISTITMPPVTACETASR